MRRRATAERRGSRDFRASPRLGAAWPGERSFHRDPALRGAGARDARRL